MGRTILGLEEKICSLTQQDLVDYISTHGTAPQMVIVGARAIDHHKLCGLAAEQFEKLPLAPKSGVDVSMEPAVVTGSGFW